MNNIRQVLNHLTKGHKAICLDKYYLKMNYQGKITDQEGRDWDIKETDPNDYKIMCKFIIGNRVEIGYLLNNSKDTATVIVDGYECSDTIPLKNIIEYF